MKLSSDIIDAEPSSYEEVAKKKGKETMIKEYQFKKNDVYDAVSRPEGKSIVYSMWIYKIQHVVDGIIMGHKERFVARGFSHKEGTNYEETFAPVTRYTSIISIGAGLRWEIHQQTSR